MIFQDFLDEHKSDPFLLHAAMMKKAEKMAGRPIPKEQETAVEIALTAKALNGLMQLKVDSQWDTLVKATLPWSRKKLLKTEKEWKNSRLQEKKARAHEEVELVSANW